MAWHEYVFLTFTPDVPADTPRIGDAVSFTGAYADKALTDPVNIATDASGETPLTAIVTDALGRGRFFSDCELPWVWIDGGDGAMAVPSPALTNELAGTLATVRLLAVQAITAAETATLTATDARSRVDALAGSQFVNVFYDYTAGRWPDEPTRPTLVCWWSTREVEISGPPPFQPNDAWESWPYAVPGLVQLVP